MVLSLTSRSLGALRYSYVMVQLNIRSRAACADEYKVCCSRGG